MYLDWFIGRMKKTFNIVVPEDEVSYEAYYFYHEDLDDLLIPSEHIEKLRMLKKSVDLTIVSKCSEHSTVYMTAKFYIQTTMQEKRAVPKVSDN